MGAIWFRDEAAQILDATRFLSRLPLPAPRRDPQPLAVTLRFAPLAALPIAVAPAGVLVAALAMGVPSLAAATLAAAGLTLLTGALHEDGFADTADGFGGGATPARKLEIMRDSRIGSFGALALGVGLLIRVASLQGIAERSGALAAAAALVAAAVLSRAMMLVPLSLLQPARADGLAKAAGTPEQSTIAGALLMALPIAGLLSLRAMPDGLHIATAMLFSAAAALAMTRLARRQIGGVTGDVVGATQQVCELTFLLALCAGAL